MTALPMLASEPGIPRRCGDGPDARPTDLWLLSDSPQVRGWPLGALVGATPGAGFPAGAGMAPCWPGSWGGSHRIPRRCGDGPSTTALRRSLPKDSPQVRGWPFFFFFAAGGDVGFPAGAGMAPYRAGLSGLRVRIPRRCGDGPMPPPDLIPRPTDSPQVRGWPPCGDGLRLGPCGFPAGAGMARLPGASSRARSGIPRRCGDGPAACAPPTRT